MAIYFAIARDAVNPGDSIPYKLIRLLILWWDLSLISKSLILLSFLLVIGLMPEYEGDNIFGSKEGRYFLIASIKISFLENSLRKCHKIFSA